MGKALPRVTGWLLSGTLLALLLVTVVPALDSTLRFAPLDARAWLAGCALDLVMVLPFQWNRLVMVKVLARAARESRRKHAGRPG